MIKINNNECKILSTEIKHVNATYNKKIGYSVLVNLDIEMNNNKGYVSFYIDFFDDANVKNIENKKYEEIPSELNSKITMIEIFDTKNFIDFINSKIILEFGNIENNQIETTLIIHDDLINLEYRGLLDIK